MNMDNEILHTVMAGVVAWSAAFIIIRMAMLKRSFDFCNRLVSLMHVGVALWMASASVKDWRHPLQPLASPSSPLQIRALAVSLSYFIYDFFCCLFDSHISVSNCIHHTVSILGLLGGISYGVCGTELVGSLLLTEISSPFLHMRELLKELGYKDTNLNLINDICFAFIFTFARLIIAPYLTFATLKANNPFIIKGTALGLQVVSIFWFYKIVRMVYYKLVKRRKGAKSS